MFRHGVRTVNHIMPKDPFNADYWSQYGGIGELTSAGNRQMTVFGSYFGQYYKDRFNMSFNPSLTFARSTYFNRTIQTSSSSFSRGLFGENSMQIVAKIHK